MHIASAFSLGDTVIATVKEDYRRQKYTAIDPLTGRQSVWTIFGTIFFEGQVRHIAKAPDIEVAVPPELNESGEVVTEAATRRQKSSLNHWFAESEIRHTEGHDDGTCTHAVKFDMDDLVYIHLPVTNKGVVTGYDKTECARCGVCKIVGVRIERDKTLYRVENADPDLFSGWRSEDQLVLYDS